MHIQRGRNVLLIANQPDSRIATVAELAEDTVSAVMILIVKVHGVQSSPNITIRAFFVHNKCAHI